MKPRSAKAKGRRPAFKFFDDWWDEDVNGCWLWQKTTISGTYGQVYNGNKLVLAHRFSWERAHGPIPEGKMICHKCDVPGCVNPDHLYVGDAKSNIRDAMDRGRHKPCKGELNGHAKLTEDAVKEIRARHKQYSRKDGSMQLARELGVTAQCVAQIANRTWWKHVT